MMQKGPKWCNLVQRVVLMWCICGKLESVKPEKRVVLMVHLWWKCGGGVEKVWSICGKSKSAKPEKRMVLMRWECGEKVWKSVESAVVCLIGTG